MNTAKEGEDDGLDDGLMMAMGDEERETKAEQVTASHALALAVCAALTRSPDVAADPSFRSASQSSPPPCDARTGTRTCH